MDPHDQDALPGLAAALAGEPTLAAELLAEVDLLAPPRRGDDDDLDDARRTLLVQRFLRRRAPQPAAEHPELTEELRPVRQRLDALEPFPRAALVLRHHQRLLVAELARLTERSPAAVDRALDAAEAAVATDPFTLDLVLAQAPRPERDAVRSAARRFAALRRRRRGQVVLAALTVVALLAGISVLPGLLRPDPYARSHGEWVHGFRLADSPAVTVEGRSISAAEDALSLTWIDEARTSCDVTVRTERERVPVPAGRPVQVDHRPARFLPPSATDFGALWVSVGPRTAARVACEVEVEDATLLAIASLLRFGPVPLELPFALRDLPAPDEVRTIFDFRGSVGAVLTPAGQEENSPDTLYISVPDLFDLAHDEPTRTVAVGAARGEVVQGVDGQSVCWKADGKRVCAGTFPLQDSSGSQKQRLLDRLVRTARLLELAPDLDDRATWFDARDALPG